MSSHSKRVGDIGEANIIARLTLYPNIHVSKPFGENCPYDLIIDINGKLYKTQVKTTEKVKNGKMVFKTCSINPLNAKRKIYTKDEVDLFAFYCVENGYCGIAKISEVGLKNFTIREIPPKNKSNVNMMFDFMLDKKIEELS